MRLVLSGRTDPPLAVARMRLAGELCEIRARHLRFSTADAAAMLSAADVSVRPDQVALLVEQTDGWAAGLRLAGLSLREVDDSDRFLSDLVGNSRAAGGDRRGDRPDVARALGRFAWGTRRYLVVTTVFGLGLAVLDTVAVAALGIPLAVLWGLLAFVTNYIPYVGFWLGVLPPALLALLVGGWRLAAVVLVIYLVLNFATTSLVQPHFVGDAVGLSVTVTFVALVFWAWILGPIGAVLAVPLTLLAKALLVDTDPRAGWADALLGSASEVRRRNVSAAPASGVASAPAQLPDVDGEQHHGREGEQDGQHDLPVA
jgi:hypothetical protein